MACKIKNFNIKFENRISDYLFSSCFKTHWQSDVIDNSHTFLIIQHALIIFNKTFSGRSRLEKKKAKKDINIQKQGLGSAKK